ncbi:MAG: tetratricopeptide repeat protein, partial [Cyanobacteria bacterium J06555_3]
EYFQQAHLHHPEEIKPQLQKVQVLNGMGLCSQARQQLELLQNNYPDSFLVMMQSGHFFRQLHQRAKALQWYCLAQSKAPSSGNSLEAELCSVEELRDLGRFDEAKKQIEAIISQFPHNIRAQLIQASIWQKTAKFAAATQIYEEILSIEPEHLPAQMKLAQIYSQSGQVEKAIALLEAADQSSARNMQLLSRLGTLYQALDNWDAARQCYQRMCEEYPDSPQGYCLIANLMFLKGKGEAALTLLKQVQARLPDSAQIVQKLVEIQLRLGYLDAANRLLDEKIVRFPTYVQLHWQRCRLYLEQGDNLKALKALEQITTDNQDWILQTESLKARIYFHQYNYYQAEAHLKKAISAAAVAIAQRNLLASAKMLTGRFDEASQELKLATQELKLKSQPGKVAVPLRGHCAMIVNELRINPPLLTQLQAIEKLTGFTKIVELGNLLVKEPNYFGTALYLAKELRQQGIFDLVKDSLSSTKAGSVPSIPSKIVQYWNDPNPPADVERVCQSWIEQNPGYEYIRFSEDEAIAFLHHHYDKRVVNAFNNCDEAATQSDFFRLAYLNQMGGFYADTDDLCRQPLAKIVRLNPELVVLQEDLSCIGNNFIGCIPHQSAIRTAFYQAVNNLNHYCNESPWFKTGPALLTSVICSSLVPYLTYADYQMWPRLLVLSQAEIRKIICPHLFLAYKNTSKSWQRDAYQRRIKSSS